MARISNHRKRFRKTKKQSGGKACLGSKSTGLQQKDTSLGGMWGQGWGKCACQEGGQRDEGLGWGEVELKRRKGEKKKYKNPSSRKQDRQNTYSLRESKGVQNRENQREAKTKKAERKAS